MDLVNPEDKTSKLDLDALLAMDPFEIHSIVTQKKKKRPLGWPSAQNPFTCDGLSLYGHRINGPGTATQTKVQRKCVNLAVEIYGIQGQKVLW